MLDLYALRQTVLCAKHGKLQLRRPFLSKPAAICKLFQKVYHCFYRVLLSVLHRTLADDQAFSTCHWFCLTDFPVHLVLDSHLWFLWKEKRSRYWAISPSLDRRNKACARNISGLPVYSACRTNLNTVQRFLKRCFNRHYSSKPL